MLFSADEDEITIGADRLRVTGNGLQADTLLKRLLLEPYLCKYLCAISGM